MSDRPLPIVSDHAVLRYLERAHGVPVEAIRAALADSAAIGIAHGAPVVLLDHVKLVIVDGRVVTTLKGRWAREIRTAGAKPRRRPTREKA